MGVVCSAIANIFSAIGRGISGFFGLIASVLSSIVNAIAGAFAGLFSCLGRCFSCGTHGGGGRRRARV
ncbi:BZ3500_MvSof-1268-A1-R1_Chr1-3g02269 [Microbotryum saponariae]|uniref:BZ3500_MvSof-1268-A1-R1_Chr1-3g02269 protein n=1 Tax=Microbotryum saponariae TaxID=289078 RepID=A0A2X0LIC7_9BASI|nr:BZ3500_MvSof-1268-A1-R1_Chr1-3g02269 [Microbotryum saponariae]SCZ95833.1 BZ3501_MvSof-1269-A2-R1_Chr1-3g01872 [Microbotryum saponariae]